MPAHYPLEAVKGAARAAIAGAPPEPFFNHKHATDIVSGLLDLDFRDAKAFILETLTELNPGNYSKTSPTPAPPADIYGVEARGRGWYAKIKLPPEKLEVWSFHPPTDPIRTQDGTTVRR